jgi:hypothetical protein
MTLVLVLLAGAAMVGLAQRSLLGALEAKSAEQELQRRWAVASLRAAMLGRLETVLDSAEADDAQRGRARFEPLSRRRLTVELAGRRYHLVVTDEQAKLNANTLLRSRTRGETVSVLRNLVGRTGPGATVRVRPTRGAKAVFGYGQLFEGVPPARLVGEGRRNGLAARVTCWGDGKVNLRRASDAVIRQAIRREVGPRVVRLLLEYRRNHPGDGLDRLLRRIDKLGDEDRRTLQRLLTDKSDCHGLWIVTRAEERQWYTLAISVTSGREVIQWYEFAW